jgi:hypothetical protein
VGRNAEGRTDRHTDRQTDRQTYRQTGRQTNRQTEGQANRQTEGQANRQTDRQTDIQTDRQTDRKKNSVLPSYHREHGLGMGVARRCGGVRSNIFSYLMSRTLYVVFVKKSGRNLGK